MFTTGNDLYPYLASALYAVSLVLFLFKFRSTAMAALVCGTMLNLLYLAGRAWLGGVFIPNPMFEGPYLLPCLTALITIIAGIRDRERNWGLFLFLVIPFSGFAIYYPTGMIPPTPNKITIWAHLFFLTETGAHVLFYCGGLMAFLSLTTKNPNHPFHDYLVWGFILYSIAQVTGAVWCYLGWGNTFRWGARHMNSAALWLLYAAYLHLRFMPWWDSKRKAFYACAASGITLVVTFMSYLHEMGFPRIGG